MIRCRTCCLPNTRPDTPFIDGQCSACVSFAKRPTIDWDARKADLLHLLDRHGGRCIVPSSGGKDSTAQALTLLELGADVTVVTARTCHLTAMGRANIDNLARYCRTIEVTPNMTVRAKLNRLALERVGDISWPEHCAIFTTPFKVALQTGHTLMFYGENPQAEYGGPMGTDEARTMTRRWITEFGGFLGLRPQDFIGVEGVTKRDMEDYMPPPAADVVSAGVEAHFLGQYLLWDGRANAEKAIAAGMVYATPTPANWWPWENLDNGQTGVHDRMMFVKYGFGRGCQQISVDVRHGRIRRDAALDWVKVHDGLFPTKYAGVHIQDVLARIGMPHERLTELECQFRQAHAG